MRLAIERPSPVELSPPVGLAESRWKRPNSRPHILRREARALIGDADHRLAVLAPRVTVDAPADRAVFHGVADEIVDRLAQPLRIAADEEAGLDASTSMCLVLAARRACGCSPTTSATSSAEIEPVGAHGDVDRVGARVGDQIVDHGGQPARRLADMLDLVARRLLRRAATRRETRSGSRCGRGSRRAGSSDRARPCRAPRS